MKKLDTICNKVYAVVSAGRTVPMLVSDITMGMQVRSELEDLPVTYQ